MSDQSSDIHHVTWAHQPEQTCNGPATFIFAFQTLVCSGLSFSMLFKRDIAALVVGFGMPVTERDHQPFPVILLSTCLTCVWMLPVRNQFNCLHVRSFSAVVKNNISALISALLPQTKHTFGLFTPQSSVALDRTFL